MHLRKPQNTNYPVTKLPKYNPSALHSNKKPNPKFYGFLCIYRVLNFRDVIGRKKRQMTNKQLMLMLTRSEHAELTNTCSPKLLTRRANAT